MITLNRLAQRELLQFSGTWRTFTCSPSAGDFKTGAFGVLAQGVLGTGVDVGIAVGVWVSVLVGVIVGVSSDGMP